MSDGEYLTEETYYYDSMTEAIQDMEVIRAERGCDLAFDLEPLAPEGPVRMIVKVGKVYG